jgi:hypothetical protein
MQKDPPSIKEEAPSQKPVLREQLAESEFGLTPACKDMSLGAEWHPLLEDQHSEDCDYNTNIC